MSALTPDAACDAYRALKLIAERFERRFADYVRRRLPKRKKLIEETRVRAPAPGSIEELVPFIVEEAYLGMLRLKVEKDVLPASGPAVTLDDLSFVAGPLAAPFISDLEAGGVLKDGATEIAKTWRPKGLKPGKGAFLRALKAVFKAVEAPEGVGEAVAPLLVTLAEGQACLRYPSSAAAPKQAFAEMAGHVETIRRKHGVTLEGIFERDELAQELLAIQGDRKEFDRALDQHLFAVGDKRVGELKDAAGASLRALTVIDASAENDLEGLLSQLDAHHAEDRVRGIVYGVFLREEADLIWGKTDIDPA